MTQWDNTLSSLPFYPRGPSQKKRMSTTGVKKVDLVYFNFFPIRTFIKPHFSIFQIYKIFVKYTDISLKLKLTVYQYMIDSFLENGDTTINMFRDIRQNFYRTFTSKIIRKSSNRQKSGIKAKV